MSNLLSRAVAFGALGAGATLAALAFADLDAAPSTTTGGVDSSGSIRSKLSAFRRLVRGIEPPTPVTISPFKDSQHYLADQSHSVVKAIAAKCRYYTPDFSPKPVPAFYDLSGITEDPIAFQATVDIFVDRYKNQPLDKVRCRAALVHVLHALYRVAPC